MSDGNDVTDSSESRRQKYVSSPGKIPLKIAFRQLWQSKVSTSYTSRGLLSRLLVDLLMANIGLFLGYVTTIAYHILVEDVVEHEWIVQTLTHDWVNGIPAFTALCLLIFVFGGMYRWPPGHHPLKRLIKSWTNIGFTYLAYIGIMYAIRTKLPRTSVIFGFIFSGSLISGVRVLRTLFFQYFSVEPRHGPRAKKVDHVLVIGGAGYIGSTLTRTLLDAQYHVRVLDMLMFGDDSVAELKNNPRFELVKGDFRNVETIVRSLRGMDAVIHLGAIVGDPACSLDDELTVDINTNAVRLIREVCKGYGIQRFVFASTCSVYGAQEYMINENSELAPVSLYAKSKIDAENALLSAANTFFRPTILRLATVFGLSYRMRFDLVVNLLTAKAIVDGKITIFNGHQWRPFIHVKDVAEAFMECLGTDLGVVGGRIFNVGDNENNYTIDELGKTINNIIPDAEVENITNSSDPRNYRVDFSRIKNLLGFQCKRTLEEGVREVATTIKNGQFVDYHNPIFSNVAMLEMQNEKQNGLVDRE